MHRRMAAEMEGRFSLAILMRSAQRIFSSARSTYMRGLLDMWDKVKAPATRVKDILAYGESGVKQISNGNLVDNGSIAGVGSLRVGRGFKAGGLLRPPWSRRIEPMIKVRSSCGLTVVPLRLARVSVGDSFGRLTILGHPFYAKTRATPESFAVCSCSCGAVWCGPVSYLRSGKTKSCGCFYQDNRRSASRTHGMFNTRKRRDAKTSQFKGVSWCSNVGRWRAQIHEAGCTSHIGLFDTETEAARAYDRRANLLFGEYARLNFKDGGARF